MAHTPQNVTAPTTNDVSLMSSSTTLASYPLIKGASGNFARNRKGYQPWGGNTQYASGDGRKIVGERSIDILVSATSDTAYERVYDLDGYLESATHLKYDGATFAIAKSRGITAIVPLGTDDLRVTITYLPSTQEGALGASSVLGPL